MGFAQDPGIAAEIGSSGASRGDLQATTSVLSAPAILALVPRYDISAGVLAGPYQQRSLQGAAIDSTTSRVTLGLSYLSSQMVPPATGEDLPGWRLPDEDTSNPVNRTTIGASLAMAWLDRKLGVGLGGVWYRSKRRFGEDGGTFNGTVSVGARLADQLTLSVTGENLVPTSFSGDDMRVGLGLGWQPTDRFGLFLDGTQLLEDQPLAPGWRAGLRGVAGGWVVLRAGMAHEPDDPLRYATLGLGGRNEQMSLDYGVRAGFGSEAQARWGTSLPMWHGLSLQVMF